MTGVGRRRVLLAVVAGLALVLVAVLVAPGIPSASRAGSTPGTSEPVTLPPRESRFASMTSHDLWEAAAVTPAQTLRQAPGAAEVAIGLRAPGESRGVWRGSILISDEERSQAMDRLRDMKGVKILDEDDELPVVRAEVASEAVLDQVRTESFVDYVEPTRVPVAAAGSGCGGTVLDTAGRARVDTGDVLPWTYDTMGITRAWGRGATGAGMTVAVLDVGIIWDQGELRPDAYGGAFSTGLSTGRWVRNLGAGDDSPWTECEHGTRVAGLVAAPRNGHNIVGIAWKANLVTVATAGDVIVGLGNSWWIADGIRKARQNGARVINMSFGSVFWLSQVADEISYQYYRTDLPEVVFVGAAGTGGPAGALICPYGTTYFPSYLPEVISVAAVDRDRTTVESSLSCSGPDVDIAAISEDGGDANRATESTGRNSAEVMGLGSSSGATGTISGIIALIWSHYPDWTRDQVVKRLYRSTGTALGTDIGWGVPDAWKAVGGLWRVSVQTSSSDPAPGTSYELTAVPAGDGPLTYLWNDGQTTPHITTTMGGAPQTWTVQVTDTSDGTSVTGSIKVYPEVCADLRRQIQAIDTDIARLQEQLRHAASDKASIVAQIGELREQKGDIAQELRARGCA